MRFLLLLFSTIIFFSSAFSYEHELYQTPGVPANVITIIDTSGSMNSDVYEDSIDYEDYYKSLMNTKGYCAENEKASDYYRGRNHFLSKDKIYLVDTKFDSVRNDYMESYGYMEIDEKLFPPDLETIRFFSSGHKYNGNLVKDANAPSPLLRVCRPSGGISHREYPKEYPNDVGRRWRDNILQSQRF